MGPAATTAASTMSAYCRKFSRNAWPDGAAFDETARKLAQAFRENFRQYADMVDAAVVAAGPIG